MIEIKNINIEAIKRDRKGNLYTDMLLRNVNLNANPGEIILLIGPSGSGKSLLTNFLLGLISPHNPDLRITKTGDHSCYDITVDGERFDILGDVYPQKLKGKIGIMFQAIGLLDDLIVEDNIAIANDQSCFRKNKREFAAWQERIFREDNLAIDDGLRRSLIGPLSGGQRQRVAFARTLAFQPQIRILDEPTSALDPNTTQRVLELIQETQCNPNENQNQQGKAALTIIITHDYEGFLPIANRVWFIDQKRNIHNEEIPQDEAQIQQKINLYKQRLAENRPRDEKPLSEKDHMLHKFAVSDIKLNNQHKTIAQFFNKNNLPKRFTWFFKFFGILFNLLVSRALLYILVAGFFIGLVSTYFSLNSNMGQVDLASTTIDVEKIAKPLLFEEMLSGFGVVMFRALIPLFTCIFIAARSGTAITAYLSLLCDKDRKQWDAFTTLGIKPGLFFFPQILVCFTLGCFVLSYLAFFAAALGCFLVSVYSNPLCSWFTWKNTFWSNLHPEYLFGMIPIFSGFGMFVIKTVCAGTAISLISFFFGTRERKNSIDTLKYLIKSNVFNMIAILILFFILLILEAS